MSTKPWPNCDKCCRPAAASAEAIRHFGTNEQPAYVVLSDGERYFFCLGHLRQVRNWLSLQAGDK